MFNELKATALAIEFMKLNDNKLNYTKLIKLMYLADREMLIRYNQRISYDYYLNLSQGVVLSNVYDCITNNYGDSVCWLDNIDVDRQQYMVTIKPNIINFNVLSDKEFEIIRGLDEQYKDYDWKRLVDDVIHELPEWEDPRKRNTRMLTFDFTKFLQILQKSQEDIQEILFYEKLNDSDYMFNGHGNDQ